MGGPTCKGRERRKGRETGRQGVITVLFFYKLTTVHMQWLLSLFILTTAPDPLNELMGPTSMGRANF